MLVEEEYVSVACNRTPEIIDWNGDLICFGACNAVAIYDTKAKGKHNLIILSHHTSKVNSVKWLRKSDKSSNEFVSCSADKTAAVWSYKEGYWKVTSELIGHSDGVTCVTGLYTKDNDLLIFTGSIDSTVRIWERKNDLSLLKQVLHLNSGLCLTVHAHLLPTVKEPILFCALDDHKIHVFTGEEFHQVHVLIGHEDWVRGLDVMNADEATIFVASASQDTYIRLWRIQKYEEEQTTIGIKVEEKVFQSYGVKWSVKLDAVLAGHEGWVYGVQWHTHQINTGSADEKTVHRLLSSSLDKTLIIWEPQDTFGDTNGEGRGMWTERVRVGEVGGNGLGFYGSCFGPNGESILGHGYNGSLHIWSHNKETDQWQPCVVPGGHFNSVEDVRWEPTGRYLLSVSTDQTTRLHAPWKRADGITEWHELARPQVHGYDMSSIAPISSVTFASSAEEKVIRAFRAPHNFVTNFENVVGEKLMEDVNGYVAEGATVPSLGLSNKAVFSGDENKPDLEDDTDGYFIPLHLTEPPTEENLMQNTLWPETHKLYGHGNEVIVVDASPDGRLLASAAKASNLSLAAIILWETTNFEEIQRLESHQLTVTQIAFSPDSKRLLSVSRDRRWTVYHRREGSDFFDVAAASDKANGVHSRIIWCCAWAHDGVVFGTGSRDGKVCVWTKTDVTAETSLKNYALVNKHLDTKTSVTAFTFAPFSIDTARVVVIGFETGILRIYTFREEWKLLNELDNSAAHHLTVKRLSFRPSNEQTNEHKLASCGNDNIVRIYSVSLS